MISQKKDGYLRPNKSPTLKVVTRVTRLGDFSPIRLHFVGPLNK